MFQIKIIINALFEVIFYDADGNELEIVRQNALGLQPEQNRTLRIISKEI
jgi:hypothetical protein